MSNIYHFDENTGEVNACHSVDNSCAFKINMRHFYSRAEAERYSENFIKNYFNNISVNNKINSLIIEDFKRSGLPVTPIVGRSQRLWKDVAGQPFKFIGAGDEYNVFLHEDYDKVIKINHSIRQCTINNFLKNKNFYKNIKGKDLLKSCNVRYADSDFMVESFKGLKTPIIIQEFLGVDYENYTITYELSKTLHEVYGFDDLYSNNIKKNMDSGVIVLFDCFPYG